MLLVGNLVSQSASQTAEVCQCYKTGHLVNAAPRAQFNAQVIGATFGAIMSVLAFWLYTAAYPCILDPDSDTCPFAVVAAHGWQVLASGMSEGITVGNNGTETITDFGYILLYVAPIGSCVVDIIAKFALPERFSWILPVWSVFYLGWMVQPEYAVAQMVGQITLWVWQWARPASANLYTYSVASGLIAGGCVATLVIAAFNVFNVPYLGWGVPH